MRLRLVTKSVKSVMETRPCLLVIRRYVKLETEGGPMKREITDDEVRSLRCDRGRRGDELMV